MKNVGSNSQLRKKGKQVVPTYLIRRIGNRTMIEHGKFQQIKITMFFGGGTGWFIS
jgi:hypothetical protein